MADMLFQLYIVVLFCIKKSQLSVYINYSCMLQSNTQSYLS